MARPEKVPYAASDIEAARDELVARGVDVSEVFHAGTPGAQFQPGGKSGRVGGPTAAHGQHEKRIGAADPNWPEWYVDYMVREQAGTELPT